MYTNNITLPTNKQNVDDEMINKKIQIMGLLATGTIKKMPRYTRAIIHSLYGQES